MSPRTLLLAALLLTGCGTLRDAVCAPPTTYVYWADRRVICYGVATRPARNVLVRCNNGWEGVVPLESLQP